MARKIRTTRRPKHFGFTGRVKAENPQWSNFSTSFQPVNRAERAPWVQYSGGPMQAGMGGMDVSQYVMGLASVGILFFVIGFGYAEGKKFA